jgi:hypothetical protein
MYSKKMTTETNGQHRVDIVTFGVDAVSAMMGFDTRYGLRGRFRDESRNDFLLR